jgi:hypothetical protein
MRILSLFGHERTQQEIDEEVTHNMLVDDNFELV